MSSSLDDLQNDEQRRVLDTVAQVRKCGLDSILSLPQIVVCGQQSSGKSSTLEALTEIPFPRNDNLCTRYATEIILRCGPTESLTIKIIPDTTRPQSEQANMKTFEESITDLQELPRIMDLATDAMGIKKDGGSTDGQAFARDVLSIEIEGPSRPQLTLVDIPGLIETATKGTTDTDIDLVTEITNHYILQPRTICLAVISATSDYATQRILTKVRDVDPEGDRTLGIITKPDRVPAKSGSERAFIELAQNKDIFFKLGWHVLKNRTFEEDGCTFEQRNDSEARFFRNSNFSELGSDNLGIESLKSRLSALLFEHIKRELPRLRTDLEETLKDTKTQLESFGSPRSSLQECRTYLANLSLDFYELCKAGASGAYESQFFEYDDDDAFTTKSPKAIRRLRAIIQLLNKDFNEEMMKNGKKFRIESPLDKTPDFGPFTGLDSKRWPIDISKSEALAWVQRGMVRTRGREVMGTFNPLLIGELFWELSDKWQSIAKNHIEEVAQACRRFLDALLTENCPKDIKARLWSGYMENAFDQRVKTASQELERLIQDQKDYPINYNHYFTDTVNSMQRQTFESSLTKSIEAATIHTALPDCNSTHKSASIDIHKVVRSILPSVDPSMDNVSCEKALDHALALYKVS